MNRQFRPITGVDLPPVASRTKRQHSGSDGMRSITFDTRVHQPFEIGALLCATLAYPLLSEIKARKRAARAWCAEQLRVTIAAEPRTRDDLAALFPAYAALSACGDKQAFRTTERRFRDRMIAARMMRGYIGEALTSNPTALPPGMRRLSINELARFVQPETGESDPENVKRRVWRLSRPVVHLASAFDLFFAARDPGVANSGYDLQNLDDHRTVLALATYLQHVLLADKRLKLPPAGMLRLRWIQ